MSTIRKELVVMIDRALGDDPKAALVAARNLVEEADWLTKRAVASGPGVLVAVERGDVLTATTTHARWNFS